jgi:hypothetical protein
LGENVVVVADEVAGEDHNVRLQGCDCAEGRNQVLIVHASTYVDVADLNQRATCQSRRQPWNAQGATDQFEPMRLDLPRVQAGGHGPTER